MGFTKLLIAEPSRVRGKRVIELGTGCGLVGLVAGALGAREVTLTDEVICLAAHNRDVNFCEKAELHQRFKLQKLSWGDQQQIEESKPPFDVIIGSDILWYEAKREILAETLIALSGPGTRIILASP